MPTVSLNDVKSGGRKAEESIEVLQLKGMPTVVSYSSSQLALAIIGNGNYGKALSLRFSEADIGLKVGSRYPDRRKFLPAHVDLVSYKEAAKFGDIIFICIPASAYEQVIPAIREELIGKTVVDVSNPSRLSDPSGAQLLQEKLPCSNVVKALNTISAWALENDAFGGSRETYICGNDKAARQAVGQVLGEVGLIPVDSGRLKMAGKVETMSLKLFPEWRVALCIFVGVSVFCIFYYYLRLFGAEKAGMKGVSKLALYHANRVICWIGLWLFSSVYLPGCLAGYIQIFRGTKYKPFPRWLNEWMKSRKQLGLMGLLIISMHTCLSLIALAGEQVVYMERFLVIPETQYRIFRGFTWNAEPSLLFATISFSSFVVLGITSLPTVNHRMSWREWDFVQSWVGYFGLFFACAHVLIYAYSVFDPSDGFKHWHWNMPPAVFLQPLLPCIIIVLKAILMLPGISGYLWRIRSGWERNQGADQREKIVV